MKSYLSNKLVLNWSLRFSQCKRANFYSLCSTLVGLAMFLKFNYRVLSNMTVTASNLGPQHFFYESKNVLIRQNIFTEKVVTVKNEFYQNKKTGDLTKNLHFFMIFGDKGAELMANNCQ